MWNHCGARKKASEDEKQQDSIKTQSRLFQSSVSAFGKSGKSYKYSYPSKLLQVALDSKVWNQNQAANDWVRTGPKSEIFENETVCDHDDENGNNYFNFSGEINLAV